MIDQIRSWLADRSALTVTKASFENFNLVVGGAGWGLGTTSPWRVVQDGNLIFSFVDEGVVDSVASLLGDVLVDVEAQSSRMRGDPTLILASGRCVEVFADTQVDPWVFTTPDVVYVGTPGDATYNR